MEIVGALGRDPYVGKESNRVEDVVIDAPSLDSARCRYFLP